MLKQELYSEDSLYNLIDFLIQKKCKRIFINFSYFDDNEKPSISIGSFDKSISMESLIKFYFIPIFPKESQKNIIPLLIPVLTYPKR